MRFGTVGTGRYHAVSVSCPLDSAAFEKKKKTEKKQKTDKKKNRTETEKNR